MSFNLWDFLFYHLPWWLQISLLAIPVAVAFWFAIQIFGWEKVRGWIAPALAILAALGLASRAQQKGYADRRAEDEKALDKAEDFADEKRDDVQDRPDDKLNQDFDRWTKR